MTILDKINFTLTKTNAPKDSYKTYQAGMSVIEGEIIIYEEQKYKAAKAAPNMQLSPDKDINTFVHIGAINEKAMIDGFITTQTIKKDGQSLKFSIDTGKSRINCFSLFNIDGEKITITRAGKTIYEKSLITKKSSSWWEYFYERGKEYERTIIINIPMLFGEFEVEITPNKFGANLGHFSAGQKMLLGPTELGAEIGVIDYSKKFKNEYGDITIIKGRTARYMNLDVVIDTRAADKISETITKTLGTLTTFIGDEKDSGIKSLIVFGFLRDYNIKITSDQTSSMSLNIEGIV